MDGLFGDESDDGLEDEQQVPEVVSEAAPRAAPAPVVKKKKELPLWFPITLVEVMKQSVYRAIRLVSVCFLLSLGILICWINTPGVHRIHYRYIMSLILSIFNHFLLI